MLFYIIFCLVGLFIKNFITKIFILIFFYFFIILFNNICQTIFIFENREKKLSL